MEVQHDWNNPKVRSRIVPPPHFLRDAAAGKLPAVSWLTPPLDSSDHPPGSICVGALIVTATLRSARPIGTCASPTARAGVVFSEAAPPRNTSAVT